MLSADLDKKLEEEFNEVKKGTNPEITSNIDAVVVLSGESRDPAIKTSLRDTEERLAEGIRIYKKIRELGGSPTLILNGTDPQNIFMEKESRKQGVDKIMIIKNPPYPKASTKTQIQGVASSPFKNLTLVIHAYVGPRTNRYIRKYLADFKVKLFLINRHQIDKKDQEIEIGKIIRYFPEEFEN